MLKILAVVLSLSVACTQGHGNGHGHDHHGDHRHTHNDNHDHSTDSFKITTIKVEPYYNGNQGYIVDLIKELQHVMGNFTYQLNEVADGMYGSKIGRRWRGMIGEVISADADFAAAPLYITSRRARVVDFTVPFMKFGLAVLVKKPQNGQLQITSLSALVRQTTVAYGTLRGGSLPRYLARSRNSDVRKMYRWMRLNSNRAYVDNVEEGVRRVMEGNYAFVLEEPFVEYLAHKTPCLMADFSFPADSGIEIKFGLAFKKGNSHFAHFNDALKMLKSSGELGHLHHKWFHSGCDSHSHSHHPGNAHDHDDHHQH
ncbi:unnamed protein product [Owenia fusiformis]|uniref:Uncharacterized protein n=1 Tax=Owenia fusiformis TaxID=6347 RepID=A0A8J1XT04_OWEFU|nr:unnamed protein product [Owenia fusiformis]